MSLDPIVRRWLYATLFFTAAVSLAGNAMHASVTYNGATSRPFTLVWFAVPTLILLLGVHVVGLLTRRGVSGWLHTVLAVGVVLVSVGSFYASFTAVRDLTELMGAPHATATVFPLIVDALAVIVTAALVADRPAVAEPAVETVVTDSPEVAEVHAVPVDAEPVDAEVVDVPEVAEFSGDHARRVLAARIVEGQVVKQPVELVERVIGMLDAGGFSERQIAREVDVHPSVIRRIRVEITEPIEAAITDAHATTAAFDAQESVA